MRSILAPNGRERQDVWQGQLRTSYNRVSRLAGKPSPGSAVISRWVVRKGEATNPRTCSVKMRHQQRGFQQINLRTVNRMRAGRVPKEGSVS
jgi:hypothetical protein